MTYRGASKKKVVKKKISKKKATKKKVRKKNPQSFDTKVENVKKKLRSGTDFMPFGVVHEIMKRNIKYEASFQIGDYVELNFEDGFDRESKDHMHDTYYLQNIDYDTGVRTIYKVVGKGDFGTNILCEVKIDGTLGNPFVHTTPYEDINSMLEYDGPADYIKEPQKFLISSYIRINSDFADHVLLDKDFDVKEYITTKAKEELKEAYDDYVEFQKEQKDFESSRVDLSATGKKKFLADLKVDDKFFIKNKGAVSIRLIDENGVFFNYLSDMSDTDYDEHMFYVPNNKLHYLHMYTKHEPNYHRGHLEEAYETYLSLTESNN